MTRHSRNCTANSVYSYHEKQKDARASGFGSLKLRFSKDAIKEFDCCSLNLHPCKDPVITSDGYLFEKESILEYIITKKNEVNKSLKEYEKQCNKERTELEEIGQAEQRSLVEKFLKTESGVCTSSLAARAGTSKEANSQKRGPSTTSTHNNKLPSFWVPSMTPGNKTSKIERPDKKIYCPVSGNPIRMKDLIPVKFTLSEDPGEKVSLEAKRNRYKCPVTGDVLGNNVPCAVIKTTGDVVTMECVNLIKKDMIHPITGQKLKDSDIIPIQRGGTGFSSVNSTLVGVKARPVMQT